MKLELAWNDAMKEQPTHVVFNGRVGALTEPDNMLQVRKHVGPSPLSPPHPKLFVPPGEHRRACPHLFRCGPSPSFALSFFP